MKKNTPPFPRLGEVLRTITLALDTKNANGKIDTFAQGEDVKWFAASDIIKKHIYEPLKISTDDDFAQYVAGFFEYLTRSYIELVKNISVDNLDRRKVLPILSENFFCMQAYEFMRQIQIEFRGPSLLELLQSEKNSFAFILDWFYQDGSKELHKLAFPTTVNSDKIGRDNFIRWVNGPDIPDASSLKLFLENLDKKCQKLDIVKLKQWLTVARVIAWFEREYPELPIRAWMMRHQIDNAYLPNIVEELNRAVRLESKRVAPIFELAYKISAGLTPSEIKPHDAQEKLKTQLSEFEALLKIHDPDDTMGSFLEWNWGRWHVLAGQYDDAAIHYKLAFQLAHYRAGENQRRIIKESLVLAGYIADKTFLKKMKHHAISFGLFKSPESPDLDVIEQWEFEQLARQFVVTFPIEGRFTGAVDTDLIDEGLPFLLFDEDTIKNKNPDLRKLDRVIKVIAADGQVRSYPQLRFFASWGVVNAVFNLLKLGAPVDQLDMNGASALLCAIQHAEHSGETGALDLLIKHPHKKITLDTLTLKKQINPLFCAVEYGEPEVVQRLLEMGASVDIKGNLDAKPPLYTCLDQIACLLKPHLLQKKFEETLTTEFNLHQQDAMRRFEISFVGVLGERDGLDVILKNPKNVEIFMRASASFVEKKCKTWNLSKLLRIVELLLEHGAQPNEPHSYPIRGMTPFMLAAEDDCLEAFELMLKYGGNPYKEDALGRNSLQIAREFNSVKVLTYYLFGR